ncbi:nucleoside phosphorylase [Legionella dresdenensis]|uniref:Nucleoside phosphorylase n=1 Tax=Legionella dresdenensis TaxID=450200 RepID=A0ABV8CEP2_9GAMM
MTKIIPQHINITNEDMAGNNGVGRYVILAGSDERARNISEHFNNAVVKHHPRQHNLYLGTLAMSGQTIDVASISTGMGGASADIIINELILSGARRLLRIGTAGSLQPNQIKAGQVVTATGAVRDDKASWDYIYPEYPAMASLEYVIAAGRAANQQPELKNYFGLVHSKSSLYAREYQLSLLPENEQYMNSMRQAGVLASEMECAQLFTLCSLMGYRLKTNILAGAILAIVGDRTSFSTNHKLIAKATQEAITLGLETTRQLALIDQQVKALF